MKHIIAVAGLCTLATGLSAQAAPGEDGAYLIRGGTVVSPTGQKQVANILVRNNRIISVGATA